MSNLDKNKFLNPLKLSELHVTPQDTVEPKRLFKIKNISFQHHLNFPIFFFHKENITKNN